MRAAGGYLPIQEQRQTSSCSYSFSPESNHTGKKNEQRDIYYDNNQSFPPRPAREKLTTTYEQQV